MASPQAPSISPQKGFDKKDNPEVVKKATTTTTPEKKSSPPLSKKKETLNQEKMPTTEGATITNDKNHSLPDKPPNSPQKQTNPEENCRTKSPKKTSDSPEKKTSETKDKKTLQESLNKNKTSETITNKNTSEKKSATDSTSSEEPKPSSDIPSEENTVKEEDKNVTACDKTDNITTKTVSKQDSEEVKTEIKIEEQSETQKSIIDVCKKIENNSLDKNKVASKHSIRLEVWNNCVKSSLLLFNRSCNYRIPHFKGNTLAAQNLATLDVYKSAKVVKVNLDKAHECLRLQIIEDRKELIVGCPGLREAVFLHVQPPVEPSKYSNKLASTRVGICHVGSALDFSSGVQADLVIAGSVAVDKTGRRIGKGEGFSDLEYALLKKLGGIAPDAPVITVVHDSQIYDSLPDDLFKSYDVSADYIVTPTQVIEVNPRRKQPELMWSLLSNRRINNIPIIKQLLDKEKNIEGKTITTKEEDTDTEDLEEIGRRKRYFMRTRFYSSSRRSNSYSQPDYNRGRRRRYTTSGPRPRLPQRPQQRPSSAPPTTKLPRTFSRQRQSRELPPQQEQKKGGNNKRAARRVRQNLKPRYKVEFSLKVEGLTSSVRVRDLKAALMERGVRPRDISWMSDKGIAFLHFSKPKEEQAPPIIPNAPDNILASLQNLTIKCQNGPQANVTVEPAVPSRKVQFQNKINNTTTQI